MKIAIGSANLGTKYGLFGKKKFEIKEIQKIEKILSKSRIRFIDTAHQYKNSEEIIGKSKLKNLNIITKIKLPQKSSLNINKLVNKIIFKSLKRYPRLVKYVKILKAVALSNFVRLATSLALSGRVDFPTHSIIDKAFFIEPLR